MPTVYNEPGHRLLLRLIQHRLDGEIDESKFGFEFVGIYDRNYTPDEPGSELYAERLRNVYWAIERRLGVPEAGIPSDVPAKTLADFFEDFRDFDFSQVRDVKVSL